MQVVQAGPGVATAAGTTLTATMPASPTGVLLLASLSVDKSAGTINTPTGWTMLGTPYVGVSVSQATAYRTADGTAADQTCTWTWTSSSAAVAQLYQTDTAVTGSPVVAVAPSPANDTNVSSLTADAGSATADGFAVAVSAIDSNPTAPVSRPTWSGGYTERAYLNADATGVWTASPGAAPATVNAGGVVIILAAKDLTAGDTTSTTATWAKSDQQALRVARFTAGVAAPPTPSLQHRLVGVPTDGTARVAVRVTNTTSARLKVGTDSAVTQNITWGAATTPSGSGDAHLTATGLPAGTQFYYRVAMTDADGTEHLDTGTVGRFRTAPTGASSFEFLFGSCDNTTNAPVFSTMAARDADLFLHLGDFFYSDGSGTTVDNIRAKLLARIQASNHQALFATTPTTYTPSDHDAAYNNGYYANDPTAWTNWNTAYRDLFPTPAIPAGRGVYYAFTWGRVRFIQIDTRSLKEAPGGSALGATQKQWLKDQITAATESVIIIAQPDPWIGTSSDGTDTWGAGYPGERTELANFFAASGKNIGMLGGDMHALAAEDGSGSPGGVFVLHAAPFHNTSSHKGGPYDVGPYPGSGVANTSQYGRVAVADTGEQITLTYTGHSADDTQRVTLTKTFTTPTGPTWSLWNGSTEQPLTATVWNGTTEVAATAEVA